MQDESVMKFWCQRNNEQPYIQYTVDLSLPDSLEGETIDFTECPYTTLRLFSLLVISIFGRVGHDTSWCDEWWYTPRLIQEIILMSRTRLLGVSVCSYTLHTQCTVTLASVISCPKDQSRTAVTKDLLCILTVLLEHTYRAWCIHDSLTRQKNMSHGIIHSDVV